MLANTTMELAHHSSDVCKIVQSGTNESKDFFRIQLTLAHDRGLVPVKLDIDETAKRLRTVVVGSRVLAPGVLSEAGLNAIRSQALQGLSK